MYEFFQALIYNALDAIKGWFAWLGATLGSLWNAFKQFMAAFFRPVILFFKAIFYVLNKVFALVVLIIQIIFGLFKVLIAVIVGIFNTFGNLFEFAGSTDYYYLPEAYQEGWGFVANFMNSTGLGTIALIMCVFLWMMTAYAVIKIAGGHQ